MILYWVLRFYPELTLEKFDHLGHARLLCALKGGIFLILANNLIFINEISQVLTRFVTRNKVLKELSFIKNMLGAYK